MDSVNIFVINYNGEAVLTETLESLIAQDYLAKDITLIDDGSTDKSIPIVRNTFPNVKIMALGRNTGRPNHLRKIAIAAASARYVFLIDNDIVLKQNCLTNLMNLIRVHQDIGLCTLRLMYYKNREKIYVCWTKFHYLCTSISPLRDACALPESSPVDTLGGGTMLLDREKINITGTIDDSYPMGWGEDAEIYARMKIAGFRAVYVSGAVGYHHAKEFITERAPRAFGQVRNRAFMILTMYQTKTIFLALPALLLYEIISFAMLIPKKLVGAYLAGWISVIKDMPEIMKKRNQIQATRKVPDRQYLTSGPIHVPEAYLTHPAYKQGIHLLNKFFDGYWTLIKPFL